LPGALRGTGLLRRRRLPQWATLDLSSKKLSTIVIFIIFRLPLQGLGVNNAAAIIN
jgi:hypothetical protein